MSFHSNLVTLIAAISVLSLSNTAVYGQEEDNFSGCPAEENEPWSHRGKTNGPSKWKEDYPECGGKMQSPINIVSKDAVKNENLEKLKFHHYDKPVTNGTLQNTLNTIIVTPTDKVKRTVKVNGTEYKLKHFYFHWGDSPNKGSEHSIDGVRYAMEVDFAYGDENSNKVAVAVFFKESDDKSNSQLEVIRKLLGKIKYKGDETSFGSLKLEELLPANPASYYRYQGSIPIPPCTEGLTWFVLPEPGTVGKEQMKDFREKLYSVKEEDADDRCKLINNERPVQPLNGRVVTQSK